MLVHRPRLKTQGAVVTTVAMLALGACSDPTARTDLRPEGPPEVLAVLVLNDALGGLVESATFCAQGDDKRPGLVGLPDFTTQQVCPENLSESPAEIGNAAPEIWYVRVMFDELLDPTVEDLIPILDENNQETGVFTGTLRNTQPVDLECNVGTDAAPNFIPIDYDGFYSPSGNNVTWPLGPSLVIKPSDPTIVPVETRCRITLKESIRDKAGEPIPADQRGPFHFRMAPVQVLAITPGPDETINAEFGGVDLTFNVEVDPTGFDDQDFTFTPAMTGVGVDHPASAPNSLFVYGDMLDTQDYAFEIKEGTQIADKCGKLSTLAGDNLATNFKTRPLGLVNITPFQGPNAVPSRKIRLNFNQIMQRQSLVITDDYEWIGEAPQLNALPVAPDGPFPAPQNPPAAILNDGADPSVLIVNGFFKLNTRYQLKLKAGAKISDCPSYYADNGVMCATPDRELTLEEDQIIDITTATALTNTAVSVATGASLAALEAAVTISGSGGQTIHKSDAAYPVFVRFAFNADMLGFTLDANEITITKADGTPTGIALPAATCLPAGSACAAGTASTISFNVGALPEGSYKFTLKRGATINDRVLPAQTYTQADDRVFTFNVVVDPEPPPFNCIGAP